jgi:hypothetical protein
MGDKFVAQLGPRRQVCCPSRTDLGLAGRQVCRLSLAELGLKDWANAKGPFTRE